MKKILLALCGLTALTMTFCKGCECKYQGDLDNKRWELRQQRKMRFRSHIEKMRFSPEMRKKMHERNKKQHKKG